MRTKREVITVLELHELGLNQSEIAAHTDIPRSTVRDWLSGKIPDFDARSPGDCTKHCGSSYVGPTSDYVYLLGLYLGDGCISRMPRCHRLRIACCTAYPELMDRCEQAMRAVMPNNAVGRITRIGCTEVYGDSKHWACLFPQLGAGPKHKREIKLEPWQQALIDLDPRPLIEGLIHSDGCRVLNWVNGTPYPRYHFSNRSMDIQRIFTRALDQLNIPWRNNNQWNVSIARREAVAALDAFVARKA